MGTLPLPPGPRRLGNVTEDQMERVDLIDDVSVAAFPVYIFGRSHRFKPGTAKLNEAIDRTRTILDVSADIKIAIVPASDTGAVEMALWSMLGAGPVDVFTRKSVGTRRAHRPSTSIGNATPT